MRWSPGRARRVEIGFSCGSDQWYHSFNIKPPTVLKIDGIVGNTGRVGVWVFRIDNQRLQAKNYRKQCLDWHYSQPDPGAFVKRKCLRD